MRKINYIFTLMVCISNFTIAQNINDIYVKHIEDYFTNCKNIPNYSINNSIISIVDLNPGVKVINNKINFNISKNDSSSYRHIIEEVNNYANKITSLELRTAAYAIFKTFLSSKLVSKGDKRVLILYMLNLSETVLHNVFSDLRYFDSTFYNRDSKERIKILLLDSLTVADREINIQFMNKKISVKWDTTINKKLKKEYQKFSINNRQTFSEWIDSSRYASLKLYISKYSTIKPGLIYLIGNAYLYEFSNHLDSLHSNVHYSHLKSAIELVLGRLQYKDFEQNKINAIKFELEKNSTNILQLEKQLLYLFTRNSITIYSKYLLSEINIPCNISDENGRNEKYGYYVLYKLSNLGINFPAKEIVDASIKSKDNLFNFLISFCDISGSIPFSILNDTMEWFKANKDTYNLNIKFAPYM